MADPHEGSFRLTQTVEPDARLSRKQRVTGDDIVGAVEHRLSDCRFVIECPDMYFSFDRMKLTDDCCSCQSAGERKEINVNFTKIANSRGNDQAEFDVWRNVTHLAQ